MNKNKLTYLSLINIIDRYLSNRNKESIRIKELKNIVSQATPAEKKGIFVTIFVFCSPHLNGISMRTNFESLMRFCYKQGIISTSELEIYNSCPVNNKVEKEYILRKTYFNRKSRLWCIVNKKRNIKVF
jgi:hypothetical protein